MDQYLFHLVAIRALNDELRMHFRGGKVIVSEEVKELGDIVVAHALLAVAGATEFHDYERSAGHFRFCGRRFYWSISYGNSRNPANVKITKRKLTLEF